MNTNGNKLHSKEMLIAGTTLLALGAAGCSAADAKPERGELNENITSVKLDSGANVRETPSKIDVDGGTRGNLLTQLPESIVVDTEGGVHTHDDNNGTWYSVSVEELSEKVDPETAKELKKDDDGQVWINDDRATPEYK
ncbi:MAG TPA: hypothetical protein VGE34_00255 [Candidatus Saccharimonadales bacterium]